MAYATGFSEGNIEMAAYQPGAFGPMAYADEAAAERRAADQLAKELRAKELAFAAPMTRIVPAGNGAPLNTIDDIRENAKRLHADAMARSLQLAEQIAGHKAAIERASMESDALRALAETLRPHLVNDPGNLR